MIETILYWGDIACVLIIVAMVLLILYYAIFGSIKQKITRQTDTRNNHYAILIPARNESAVIENILISIKNQTYHQAMEDVYVIVESEEDPTCDIVRRYGGTIFVRTQLENRRRKGYALDECIKDILSKGKKYDAYFIFDADNILTNDYLRQMNNTFSKGYDLACGYRRPSNPNENVIATCSALVFSMINVFGNGERAKKNLNVNITGTGFFIRGELIEEWNGYPFHTLTEDYELSLYATSRGLSTTYNENAVYLDEQPTSRKVSIKQRTRWVAGYFEARKIYTKKVKDATKEKNRKVKISKTHALGVVPYIVMVSIVIAYILFCSGIAIASALYYDYKALYDAVYRIASILISIYAVMMILALSLFFAEKNRTKFTLLAKIKATLYYPIFLFDFMIIAIKNVFIKEVTWDEIKHNGKK